MVVSHYNLSRTTKEAPIGHRYLPIIPEGPGLTLFRKTPMLNVAAGIKPKLPKACLHRLTPVRTGTACTFHKKGTPIHTQKKTSILILGTSNKASLIFEKLPTGSYNHSLS